MAASQLIRKICYVTGTRADFGLMKDTLNSINNHSQLNLRLIVTGMHLLPSYGDTWLEIESSGFSIAAKVPVMLSGSGSGAEMAKALGEQVIGITQAFQEEQPEMVLLLGDRGEMLAAAIAALHLNTPIVHIHGGELSGTIDESVRHAISKLSHYHFTATEQSRARLICMGEMEEHIFVTGAPGVDAIVNAPLLSRDYLNHKFGLEQSQSYILVLFHPVVQDVINAGEQMRTLLNAVLATDMQALILMPNADAGGNDIARVISEYVEQYDLLQSATHVERSRFLSLLAESEVIVGNSSSGIIEAASLSTPVVNVGKRQNCRERNANVVDCMLDTESILSSIDKALNMKGETWQNVYGDGQSSNRITQLLAELPLTADILDKVNAY